MTSILAPVSGTCIPVQQVKDPAFAGEMLGKGVAIQPAEGRLYAPADCEVSAVADTKHALGLILQNGAELLIHVGIDTMRLNGKYFKPQVKQGQKVKQGDLLLKFDLKKIEKQGYDTVVPIVVTNHDEFGALQCNTGEVATGDEIITID